MNDRLESFRHAIASRALVRAEDGTKIVSRSGSPVFWLFDFRSVLLQPEWLDCFADEFWKRHAGDYPFQVGGMESAGTALVAAIVMKGVQLGKPVHGFFIRKSRKKDGLLKTIEGTLTSDPVILVDDLINTGTTFDAQVKVLEREGLHVRELFAALRFREYEAYSFASDRGIAVQTIFSLSDFGLTYPTSARPAAHEYFDVAWHFSGARPSRELVAEKSAPVLADGLVIFGSDDGVVRALEAESGVLRWQYSIGVFRNGKGVLSSPACAGPYVYFGGYDGCMYCLDRVTGALVWRFDDADWIGSSPCVNERDGIVYVGLEFGLIGKRGGIAALDAATGAILWRDVTAEFTHGSPLYIPEENLVVIGSNDHVLYAYEARTGARRWSYRTRGDIKSAAAYDSWRHTIAATSMDGCCYILDARTGSALFAKETGYGIYGSPIVADRTVYIASLDKSVYAISLDDFSERWRFDTAGRIFASPAFFDGSLWIGSNDGRLYELDPGTGRLRGYFQATERIVNKPCFDGQSGRIFVGTQANELYCLTRHS